MNLIFGDMRGCIAQALFFQTVFFCTRRREGGACHMRDGFRKMGRGLFLNGKGSGSIITDLMRLTRTEMIACRFYRWRLSANFTCPRTDATAAGLGSIYHPRWCLAYANAVRGFLCKGNMACSPERRESENSCAVMHLFVTIQAPGRASPPGVCPNCEHPIPSRAVSASWDQPLGSTARLYSLQGYYEDEAFAVDLTLALPALIAAQPSRSMPHSHRRIPLDSSEIP